MRYIEEYGINGTDDLKQSGFKLVVVAKRHSSYLGDNYKTVDYTGKIP